MGVGNVAARRHFSLCGESCHGGGGLFEGWRSEQGWGRGGVNRYVSASAGQCARGRTPPRRLRAATLPLARERVLVTHNAGGIWHRGCYSDEGWSQTCPYHG